MFSRRLFALAMALSILGPARAEMRYVCDLITPPNPHGSCISSRSRPMCDTYTDSALFPIRVHHNDEEADIGEAVLHNANMAWMMQIDEWGWEPMGGDEEAGGSDALDIYMGSTGAGAGYAAFETQFEDGEHSRCTGYIVVGRHNSMGYLPTVVAHELNHILQAWTDCAEDSQFFEASAVYAQDWYDEGYGAGWWSTVYYQEGYYRNLDYFETLEPAQYGSFIFLQYLSESMGDGTPASTLELWQGAHQPDADNSVTWMDALEQWLEPRWPGPQPMGDESYTELAWQEFAEWRYFVGEHADDEHFQHGWYSATDIGLELPNITTADFSLFVGEPLERDLRFGMAETSSGVVPIRYPEVGASVTVDLVADAGEDRWALSLMSLDAVGGVIDRVRGAIAPGEATVTAIVPEGTLQMITVVANVGDGVLDPNEDDWEGTSGVLVFSTDAEAAPADDDDSEPTEEGGCECAAASVDAPIGWIGIVALVGVCGARRRGGSMRTTQGDPDARRP